MPRRIAPILPARRQRGDILLITLISLMVCLLGLVYAMRQSIVDTQAVGNNLARQKSSQVGDIAMRVLESQMLAAYGGQPLSLSATTQAWWRDLQPGTVLTPPDATPGYWANCLGNGNSSSRCAQLTLTANGVALPQLAYGVIQPTGRTDPNGCSESQWTATYYDLFVYVAEANGANGSTTEMVYKLCTANS